MCLITGHFAAERPRIWIHPSSYALVASRCRWLRHALHRDAKGYAGLGRATFVSALGKVQTTLCVALALTHGNVRLVVVLLWAEEDGWRNTFVLRILYQRLGRAYKKNQNRPAFETVLVVLDVFCPQKIFVAEMVMEAGKSKACGNYGSTPIRASQLLSMLIGC